jgi:hypothetical protein
MALKNGFSEKCRKSLTFNRFERDLSAIWMAKQVHCGRRFQGTA